MNSMASNAVIRNNNNGGAQIVVENGKTADNNQYVQVASGILVGNQTIKLPFGDMTLDENYAEISLGNASSDVQSALKAAVPDGWTQVGGGLWFRPTESSLHFALKPTAPVANDKAIYAVYAPVNADGTALTEDAQATMVALNNQELLDITLGNLAPNQSYAMILVQPDKNYGTLTLSGTETITQASTPVNYTAKFTASSTLAAQIGTNKEFTLTITLDENLTYTDGLTVASSAFTLGTVTYVEDTHTISAQLTVNDTLRDDSTFTVSFPAALRSGGFQDGGRLVTSANLQTKITVGDVETVVRIPSNVAVTNMTAPTQPVDPGTGGGGGSQSAPYLRFDSNGGTAFAPIDGHGASFTINPYDDDEYGTHIPSRPGYRFTGWYRDSRLTMRVDEDTALRITNSVTLFAGWTETSVPSMLNGDDHYAYIQGYADGTVRPNANITRAQVATIFFRLLDADVREDYLTTSNAFPDVSEGYWANTAISTMARLGVINGRNSGNFDPNAYITRAEFAAICARFDDSGVTSVSTFTDTDGHWAEDEISRAAALGWIQGYSDGTFRPNQYITRAQAVTMINRVLCRLPEDADDLLPGMNTWTDCREGDWYYLAIQEATNSHDFDAKDQVYETWTDLNADPDWSRYE